MGSIPCRHYCVFETASGPEVGGTRHAGRERVRAAFARVFESLPDATFADALKTSYLKSRTA